MLETVEQIEEALLLHMAQYQDELENIHQRVDFIKNQAEQFLERKEKELDKKYSQYSNQEKAEREYLKEYKLIKSVLLEVTENILKKDAEELLKKKSS